MSKAILFFFWMLLLGHSTLANASDSQTQTITVGGKVFRALTVQPSQVNLHWRQSDGSAYRNFSSLKKHLMSEGNTVLALMNAGIYGKADQPAGLHIEKGDVLHQLNTAKGHGNFHIQPNGVFLVTKMGKAKVLTTKRYKKHYTGREEQLQLATQSGPMLVINGKLNRRLLPKSQSNYTRNGVCTTKDGQLFFIASDHVRSNFYQFAQATQQLGCHNTLYLDGSISKLYVAEQNSTFHLMPFVGILSVTQSNKD